MPRFRFRVQSSHRLEARLDTAVEDSSIVRCGDLECLIMHARQITTYLLTMQRLANECNFSKCKDWQALSLEYKNLCAALPKILPAVRNSVVLGNPSTINQVHPKLLPSA